MSKKLYPFRVPGFSRLWGRRQANVICHADAGSAGVGHQLPGVETREPIEIIMACAAGRISEEWAVLGSNQ
jgi:hypothetical protein